MNPRPVLVIAGAGGVIGRHLIDAARARYDVRTLTRKADGNAPEGVTAIEWNPDATKEGDEAALGRVAEALEGAAALVNLAGASIANGRLDDAHKRRVVESRVNSAQTLLEAHRRCDAPPPVWFQASATGYYGDQGDTPLTEDAADGGDFVLTDICKRWETAAGDANGARLVVGRIGIVFAQDAPGWRRFVLPIKLFLGGPFGSGRQWYPWIDADDLARSILFLIEGEGHGVYNLTAPEPVRQGDLTRMVASRLSRPARLAAPPFALRLALGGLADALLLASARVLPARLQAEGFSFDCPTIERGLDKLLA